MKITFEDIDILARTIYGEARGEYSIIGLSGLIAIANIVMNRKKLGFWGNTIKEVCLKPYQFSCWNKNDPNLPVINKVSAQDELFKACFYVAEKVSECIWPDLIKGCDHYHEASIKPDWSLAHKPRISLGNHLFYKLH